MKIAAFNVENLFERARVFNLPDERFTALVIDAVAELNGLFQHHPYTPEQKARMVELMKVLDLEKSDEGDFVLLRQNREHVVARPRNKPIEIVAGGRRDWIGWAELRKDPTNDVSTFNIARVIRDVDADILAVVEAEDRTSLKRFVEKILKEVGGSKYDEFMIIDGNDERGIDVGIMTKRKHHLGLMRSHAHDPVASRNKIFSRDCPEYAVAVPGPNGDESFWVLPNHWKSKFGGDTPASKAKRLAQAKRVVEIYNDLLARGEDKIVVLGDLNDTPNSASVSHLLSQTGLQDVSSHPAFDTGPFPGRGTFGLGAEGNKIDYLMLSPALFARVSSCGLFRKGAWPGSNPPRWPVYAEVAREIDAASDHHLVWAVID